jgi:hypothetical protein
MAGQQPNWFGKYVLGGMAALSNATSGASDIYASLMLPGRRLTIPRGAIVREPEFAGVYGNPREIVKNVNIAPESPNLKNVFGVTRGDLYDIGQGGKRHGTVMPADFLNLRSNPRGSESAAAVQNPANAQRLLDILAEADKLEGLRIGMGGWYVGDPMYDRMAQMMGPKRAADQYRQQNMLMGSMSPSSDVVTEVQRGFLANYLQNQGRLLEMYDFGTLGKPDPKRPGAPSLADIGITGVLGHPWNRSAQVGPAFAATYNNMLLRGENPKVPTYVQSSLVPATGFQTEWPVVDSHIARGAGFDLVRRGESGYKGEATLPEMQSFGPWWKREIADPRGEHSVASQGKLWGALSGQTGVETPIGAPKLEIIADRIAQRAAQTGLPLDVARDSMLRGKMYSILGAPALLGSAALAAYRQQQE